MKNHFCFYIILIALQSTSLLGQNIVHNIGQAYIDVNFKRTDHIDGMTPNRLNNLKGKITSLIQFDYYAKNVNGKILKEKLISGTPTFALIFDKNKKIVEEWYFHDEKTIGSKHYYADYKNQMTDSSVFWNQEGKVFSKTIFSFKDSICISKIESWNGKNEQLIQQVIKKNDTIIVKSKYTVDLYVYKKLIETKQTPGKRYYTYSYYKSGALKEKKTLDKYGIESEEKFFENGNLEYQLINHYKNDSLEYKRERFLKYDADFRKIEEKESYYESGKTKTTTDHYIYDGDFAVRLVKERDGQRQIAGEFEYDQKGNMTMKHLYGPKETFVYKYDQTGNWIERIHYQGERIISLTERKIKYQ